MAKLHPAAEQMGIFLLEVIICLPDKFDVILLRHIDVFSVLCDHAAGLYRQCRAVFLHAGIQEKGVFFGRFQHAAYTLFIVFYGAGKAVNAIAVYTGRNAALLGAGIALQVAIQHGYHMVGANLCTQLHMALQLRGKR